MCALSACTLLYVVFTARRYASAVYAIIMCPVTASDLNYPKLPLFDILYRLSYLHSEWR